MATRTDQLLRKAMRGYLEHLGNMPLMGRITYAAVFEDVYRFLLNGSGRLELRHIDVAAVRVFLWNYKYRRCVVTAPNVCRINHCHRIGRVRAAVYCSANAAEGGFNVGRLFGLSPTSMSSMLVSYRQQYKGVGVIYPE
ncbi:hypothetical protein [Enterobacter sp.]|uniref:hypothetical protein n=1 Tax=Enterobacter sp. TaxID=42895 RepID=UPI00296F02D3|nr:hypothetical protein [Enterobacter sp.]